LSHPCALPSFPTRRSSDLQVSQRMYPASVTLPAMSTGASDMAQLRAKGIASYGLGPAVTEEDRAQYGAHSDVERLLESSLYRFVDRKSTRLNSSHEWISYA